MADESATPALAAQPTNPTLQSALPALPDPTILPANTTGQPTALQLSEARQNDKYAQLEARLNTVINQLSTLNAPSAPPIPTSSSANPPTSHPSPPGASSLHGPSHPTVAQPHLTFATPHEPSTTPTRAGRLAGRQLFRTPTSAPAGSTADPDYSDPDPDVDSPPSEAHQTSTRSEPFTSAWYANLYGVDLASAFSIPHIDYNPLEPKPFVPVCARHRQLFYGTNASAGRSSEADSVYFSAATLATHHDHLRQVAAELRSFTPSVAPDRQPDYSSAVAWVEELAVTVAAHHQIVRLKYALLCARQGEHHSPDPAHLEAYLNVHTSSGGIESYALENERRYAFRAAASVAGRARHRGDSTGRGDYRGRADHRRRRTHRSPSQHFTRADKPQ